MVRAPEMRLAGVPVRIEPAFFVIIVLLGLPQPPAFVASWVAVATISILVHEMGHAVAFRAYGLTARVVLHGFGGLTTAEGVLSPSARIVTSLAGPLSALVLVGLPAVALESSGVAPSGAAAVVLSQVVWVNVGWSLLNLLPVLPLDGGHVFLAVCDLTTKGRGRRAAEILSVAVAGAVGLWAYREGFVFGAVLALGLAAMNVGQLRKVRQEELLDELDSAHRALLDGRTDEARAILDRVRGARPGGPVRTWMAELDTWCALVAGSVPAPGGPSPHGAPEDEGDTAVRAAGALVAGRRAEGVALAAWTFAHDTPAPPKSLLAAVVADAGAAGAVASELALMGEPGRRGGELLRDLLVHLGRATAAAEVSATIG